MDDQFVFHQLPAIKGELLDSYLQSGWYRYGNKIFTINSFSENDKNYEVFWLRYNVNKITKSRSVKELIKNNRGFDLKIIPFKLTAELEALHNDYFDSIDFLTTSSLTTMLEDIRRDIYDTYLIEMRDNKKLIAAGIFDMGKNAIAGIKNIYHPDYKKYGLGKYLMIVKYHYCLENNIQWYYPGYFSPEYKKFDYKLFLDKKATEVFLPNESSWILYHQFLNRHQH